MLQKKKRKAKYNKKICMVVSVFSKKYESYIM